VDKRGPADAHGRGSGRLSGWMATAQGRIRGVAQRGWAEISRGPQRYHSTVYTRYYTTLHSLPLLPSSPPIPRYAARSYGAVPSRLASPNEKVANRVAIPHRRLVAMALRSCWAKGRRARSAGTWEDAVPSSCSFRTVQYSTYCTVLYTVLTEQLQSCPAR
jgi:hypothetical protein